MQMNITYHACQRFLERVMKSEVNAGNIKRASHWLSQEIGCNILPNGEYSLPSFDEFMFVVIDGNIVTVKKKKREDKNGKVYK